MYFIKSVLANNFWLKNHKSIVEKEKNYIWKKQKSIILQREIKNRYKNYL